MHRRNLCFSGEGKRNEIQQMKRRNDEVMKKGGKKENEGANESREKA